MANSPNVRRVSPGLTALSSAFALAAAIALTGCQGQKPVIGRERPADQADARYEQGASAFSRYCALCHKGDATGYGADHAPSLVSQTFLESASDDFLTRGIRDGRPGTAMAPYGKVRGGPLDDDEIAAIIAFLRDRGPPRVALPAGKVLGDPGRGELVYTSSCQRCHGTRTDTGNAVHLANATFLASANDGFLRHAVLHGRPGTPMPAFDGILKESEIDDVVAYVRSWSTPPERERRAPQEPPPLGEVVINPAGKNPVFTLRDGKYVPIDDVKKALDEKKRIVIIDARAVSDWYTTHIPGSISVPYYSFDRLDALPKDGTWITAYCACPHHASGVVVDELRKRGFKNTAVLDEGILEWKKRGYPIGTLPMPEDTSAATGTGTGAPPSAAPRSPFILPPRR